VPDKAELQEQYRKAVEEYRFQVDLNWRRSEYFFVLNIGVLVAGATLLASEDVPRGLVALVFGLGALLASLSILANNTQSGYYHAARDLKKGLEAKLELDKFAIATTPGMGSPIARLGKVGTFLKTMLVAIAFVDLIGAGIAIANARESHGGQGASQIVFKMPGRRTTAVTVVVSRGGEVVATQRGISGGQLKAVGLEPGHYQVWIAGRQLCSQPVDVSTTPLQLVEIACGGHR
jgi:hypothetical protein